MPTTTATLSLSSVDLTSDELSLTSTATLTKAGSPRLGLTDTTGLARKTTTSTAAITLFDGADYTDNMAGKIYIKNLSTTASEYITIFMNSEKIGHLYAGDWAFLPYAADADTNDFKYVPSVSTSLTVEYILIYE
tara:strand:+ start:1221 stop:1625 length:405 start_codon:yes stop_codon:yes gene_type:complete